MKADNKSKIDFVVLWVDDSDPVWREKKIKYVGEKNVKGNEDARYRDWDTLKYWFRGVEKFAPWVNNVYFVTDNQKPDWLNINHPKLKWVKHTDFIPEQYLPTFNSNAIELNVHRIDGLSEHFVYFNDDCFLIDKTEPEDFFIDGLPCEWPSIGPLIPIGFFAYTQMNNYQVENRHFSMRDSIKNNYTKWFRNRSLKDLAKLLIYGSKNEIIGVDSWHIQISFLKSTFNTVWAKEYETLDSTCKNKQRTKEDINCWCIKDWQILSGNFHPQKPLGQLFHTVSLNNSNEAVEYLKKQKGKVVCLNDTENENNFEEHKRMIIEQFEKLFPEKSGFEW